MNILWIQLYATLAKHFNTTESRKFRGNTCTSIQTWVVNRPNVIRTSFRDKKIGKLKTRKFLGGKLFVWLFCYPGWKRTLWWQIWYQSATGIRSKLLKTELRKLNPSAREEKKSLFSLQLFSKPRFLRTEIFGRLETQFETLSAPAFDFAMIVRGREKAKGKIVTVIPVSRRPPKG